MSTDKLTLEAYLVRAKVEATGLHGFVEEFWKASGETDEFQSNWHLEILALVLEEQAHFRVKNTVINVPPSTGKTLWVQVFWPAWIWAFIDPTRKFIFTSYDLAKLHDTARQFIQLIDGDLYRAVAPDVRMARTREAETNISTISGGRRIAVQIGGGITGKHADHIVVDDSEKAAETNPDQFAKTNSYWNKGFSQRVSKPDRYTRMAIGQRLNHDDLCGMLLRPPYNYPHVCFPMRYVPNCSWDYGFPGLGKLDVRTEPGQLLWPERYSEETLAEIEASMGSLQTVSAQMQQNPVPEKGAFFEADWFKIWTDLPTNQAPGIYQSWDLGFKGRSGKGTADSFVHGALWLQYGNNSYLYGEVHRLMNYAETKKAMLAVQQLPMWNKTNTILLEDKANGSALVTELRDMPGLPTIKLIEPSGSKEDRARRHSAKVEAGRVWLPTAEHMPSVAEFLAELVRFPHQRANDRVDTTTQYLDYVDVGRYDPELWRNIVANM